MTKPGILEIDIEQFNALLDRIEQHKFIKDDYPLIADIIRGMIWLSQTLKDQKITIHRLKKIFGFKGERTRNLPKSNPDDENSDIKPGSEQSDEKKTKGNRDENSEVKPESEKSGVKNIEREDNKDNNAESNKSDAGNGKDKPNGKRKRKGRKFSSKDYKNAIIKKISHKFLKPGCRCPDCQSGNLSLMQKPGVVLKIAGQPWLQAHIYELERLRCNTCGKTFTAKLPQDIARAPKFDHAAKAIICLLKYRGGFPFYRQESLQTMLETPVSDNVLWEMTRDVAMSLEPVFDTLIEEAAKGDCLHNDDTKARILDLIRENKLKGKKERTGIYTSAILSRLSERQIALFFTGRQHAGENLDDVLDQRPKEMATPTQMCDASNNNNPDRNQTDEGNCIAHLRRKFFEIAEIWPTYVLPIIAFLNTIFRYDREAKEQKLNEAQTFEMHKKLSIPVLENLKNYCEGLIDDKKTEPNSNLGKAINYMFNHWENFTLFVRKPGVPIDNNADERLMKRAVLNRKNGLFFKTSFGAYVGDILLSIIETCQLNNINPYLYLVAIQRHADQVRNTPSLWLPWNYIKTLSDLGLGPPTSDPSSQFEQELYQGIA